MVSSHNNLLGGEGHPPEAVRGERLDYMADLILELKLMAEKAELKGLAGALAAAQAEITKARAAPREG